MLPPEIFNQIFLRLHRSDILSALLVSKDWHNSALPHLFTNISLHAKGELVSLNRQWQLNNGRYGYMVRQFSLLKSRTVSRTAIRKADITEHRPAQDLFDSGRELEWGKEEEATSEETEWLSTVEDTDIIIILRDCSNLTHLRVSGCVRLTDQVIYTIANFVTPTALRTLHLSFLRTITPTSFLYLFTTHQFSQIEDIDLSYCAGLTDDAILMLVKASGPSLRSLKLNSIFAITDVSLHALAIHAPSLENLSLRRCWKVTNSPLLELASSCPHLQRISFAFCGHVNQDGLAIILQTLKDLKWLDITRCGMPPFLHEIIVRSWRTSWPACVFVNETDTPLSMG